MPVVDRAERKSQGITPPLRPKWMGGHAPGSRACSKRVTKMTLIECKYYIQNDYYTVLHILCIPGARGVADAWLLYALDVGMWNASVQGRTHLQGFWIFERQTGEE